MRSFLVLAFVFTLGCKGDPVKCEEACRNYAKLVFWEEADVEIAKAPPEQRDELRKGNEAQIQRMQREVPAEVVEAIKPRAVELRKKDMALVAARLKGAGM